MGAVKAGADDALGRFFTQLAESLARASFVKLVLAKHHGEPPDLQRLDVRPVRLRGADSLSFVYHHTTRDVTRNLAHAEALPLLRGLLDGGEGGGGGFRHAHLTSTGLEAELRSSKRGRATLRSKPRADGGAAPAGTATPAAAAATTATAATTDIAAAAERLEAPADRGLADATAARPPPPHDRARQRHVALTRPFLAALGVTTDQQQLVPAMARKYRQIDRFVEVFANAYAASPLGRAPAAAGGVSGADPAGVDANAAPDAVRRPRRPDSAAPLRVADFGAGKGYLTFALHDHLRHTLNRDARVTGIELRPDLVALGNATADRLGLDGLRFAQGDVREQSRADAAGAALDVVIALHACDTATDHAIHLGVRAGAAIVMCSPCCHRQIRPQLLKPHPLRPILQHGVHLAQQAEMLTDGLRALLLEACGYATQVFEFVSLEHTNKNKMILAVRRDAAVTAPRVAELQAQIDEVKRFYGIREHCLETLLRRDGRLG